MSNIRLYAQMKPDDDSLAHLQNLQNSLPKQTRGRSVPLQGIHLTLIHYGKVDDVYAVITKHSAISYDRYRELLHDYITTTERLLQMGPISLKPKGFARFGSREGTLVIEYLPDDVLLQAHAGMYDALCVFLVCCGIRDIDEFIAGDINFMHAPILKPHITLCKGYEGALPTLRLHPVTLHSMPMVYPPK